MCMHSSTLMEISNVIEFCMSEVDWGFGLHNQPQKTV